MNQFIGALSLHPVFSFSKCLYHSSNTPPPLVWTALAVEGLCCSLQHYQAILSPEALKEWDIDPSWKMRGQLVFGTPCGGPRGGEKALKPLEERVKVFEGKEAVVDGRN